jgi:hypothetical protein
MAIESLEAALFFEPAPTVAAILGGARDLVTRTSTIESIRIVPLDEEQQLILDNTDVSKFEENGKILFCSNERMRRECDDDWMLQLVFSDFDAPRQAMLNLSPLPSGGDQAEPNWSFLTEVLPIIVEIYRPTLAMCNGMSIDEGIDHLPSFAELSPGEFPPVITPWIYIGPDRLDATLRKRLANLQVARSEPLDEGWLLQVVKNYKDKPPRDVIKQLEALTPTRTKYTHTQ